MYIDRDITATFEKAERLAPIVAIVGPRQAGKTTFLRHHMQQRKANYLLFDDPDIKRIFDEDIKKFEQQWITGYDVSVLDEVHYGEHPGKKLKYLADTGKKLWITASSEVLLGKHVLSYLVGRVSILKLYPFSLHEILKAKKISIPDALLLQRTVWEHIIYGGYPKVVLTEDRESKELLLRELYDTMILKDIALSFSIENVKSLEEFARYLAINNGSIISYATLSQTLGLSFTTIKKYLAAMEKSYLIVTIPPYYTNKNKEITKQPKIYFLDTGLRNTVAKVNNVDGKLFENYILSELVKLGFSPKYWRTKMKAEVDFIIEVGSEKIPIEVKMTADKVEKSMHSYITTYGPQKALVITYKGKRKKVTLRGCDVFFTVAAQLPELLKR